MIDPESPITGSELTVLSYGGGLNSTALMIGIVERRLQLDRVLFADTGAERPDTYDAVDRASEWLLARGYPAVETVQWIRSRGEHAGKFLSLESVSLTRNELPSLAYGFAGCSSKWKRQPMDRLIKLWPLAQQAWRAGQQVVRLIGFDADEAHRAGRKRDCDKFAWRYPLIDWDWGREECQAAVNRAGMGLVAKSACYFCPAHTEKEVAQLGKLYPSLLARALALEANAVAKDPTVTPSLQGMTHRPWREVWAAAGKGEHLAGRRMDLPCGCFDGGEE